MSPRQPPSFWQHRNLISASLLPLSALFRIVTRIRRHHQQKKAVPLPVPVIVVGNITVGGSGKTPVVAWLAEQLQHYGYHPGIISRGYGGNTKTITHVPPDSLPQQAGDEPILLARLTQCPVVTGADRTAAAHRLLTQFPNCNVLISDDGLQHYRLARQIEIIVVDPVTLGNGQLLPAGPLRESLHRLSTASLLLTHGNLPPQLHLPSHVPAYPMRLHGKYFIAINSNQPARTAADFRGQRVLALAAIGRPERFFSQLRQLGLEIDPRPFADHHQFTQNDLDFTSDIPKIMTAKDAVKCRHLQLRNAWEFPVSAEIPGSAIQKILELLKNGCPPA